MRQTALKRSELKLSQVTFGCWELGGGKWDKADDRENILLIRRARETGITLFDTAVNYGDGHSECVLGEALKPMRSDCLIATKVRPEMLHRADVRRSVEGSLKRLQTDYIDLLYVHWPNEAIPIEETMGAFNDLKREGVIRVIGVSNFSLSQLQKACAYADVEIVQMEYSLLKRDIEADIMPFCLTHDIAITSYSTNAKGILAGRFHGGDGMAAGDFRIGRRLFKPEHLSWETPLIEVMKSIAAHHGVQLAQVALKWAINRPGIISAIFGTQSQAHLEENIAAEKVPLSDEEMKALTAASDQVLEKIDD